MVDSQPERDLSVSSDPSSTFMMRTRVTPLQRLILILIVLSSISLLVRSARLNTSRRRPGLQNPYRPPVLIRTLPSSPEAIGIVSVGTKSGDQLDEHRIVRFDIRRRRIALDEIETHRQPDDRHELYLARDAVEPPLLTRDDMVNLAGEYRKLSRHRQKRKTLQRQDPCI